MSSCCNTTGSLQNKLVIGSEFYLWQFQLHCFEKSVNTQTSNFEFEWPRNANISSLYWLRQSTHKQANDLFQRELTIWNLIPVNFHIQNESVLLLMLIHRWCFYSQTVGSSPGQDTCWFWFILWMGDIKPLVLCVV